MLAQGANTLVRIKEIGRADPLDKTLARACVRVNLYTVRQSDDQKFSAPSFDLVAHQGDQAFRDAPSIFPERLVRLAVNQIIEPHLFGTSDVRLRCPASLLRGRRSGSGCRSGRTASCPSLCKVCFDDELRLVYGLHKTQAVPEPASSAIQGRVLQAKGS